MKRFILRLLLFLIPFIALTVMELFVLPIDFFTFRAWEALTVSTLDNWLPGYFYPRKTIVRTEEGDSGHHTSFAVERKNVVWQTDKFGYRNTKEMAKPQAVIIGDSNTAGSGLTQKDMISEALARHLGAPAYSYAPASLNTYLRERRFREHPPCAVVVAVIERNITVLRPVKEELAFPSALEKKYLDLRCAMKESPALQAVVVPIDRFLKANMLHSSRASLRRRVAALAPREDSAPAKGGPVYEQGFVVREKAFEPVPREQMNAAVAVALSYHNLLKRLGITFVFVPIPNKENIYYDLFPGAKKPVFIRELTAELRRAGVEVIDLQTAYDETYRAKGQVVYQPDDSHWSALGVDIAARLLAETINRDRGRNSEAGPR